MKIARQQIILGVLILAIGGGGFVALDRFVWGQRLPEGLIQANGRIEGDHVTYPGIAGSRGRHGDGRPSVDPVG
jgi:hypothetical protein